MQPTSSTPVSPYYLQLPANVLVILSSAELMPAGLPPSLEASKSSHQTKTPLTISEDQSADSKHKDRVLSLALISKEEQLKSSKVLTLKLVFVGKSLRVYMTAIQFAATTKTTTTSIPTSPKKLPSIRL